MKKLLSLLLSVVMCVSLIGCGSSSDTESDKATGSDEVSVSSAEDIKVGFIFVGDENEGYTAAHYNGAQEMMEELGLGEDQVVFKWNIAEDETCYDAAVDLAEQGCNIIFANSFSHESYILQAAAEYPDVQFCHATGYQAESSGLENMHNFFTSVYESRYVSGVVAGLKIQEMIDNGQITEDEALMGYVGAYPYAEVISGYTAFYLGAKSVCPSVKMEVTYVNSWASFDLEKEAAESLIADKCVLISQHSDTTGAATACEAAGVYIVGYNISMIETAKTTALTSASINWAPYYTYAVKSVIDGEDIVVDWCQGYADGADCITELNTDIIAEGTEEKVTEVENALKELSLNVFDTSTWTVNGETYDSYIGANGVEYISDGYFHESVYGSAPAFDILIDGITDLTAN